MQFCIIFTNIDQYLRDQEHLREIFVTENHASHRKYFFWFCTCQIKKILHIKNREYVFNDYIFNAFCFLYSMLTAIFVNILIFGLNFSLLRANLTKIGWCHMILSQNQIVLRVPTAGRGWCLCRKTKMTLGIIVYRTNCFPP